MAKQALKKLKSKVVPRRLKEYEKVQSENTTRIVDIQKKLDAITNTVSQHDNRLDRLRELLSKVEHYQPTYHVSGMVTGPSRDSLDRCRTIESYLKQTAGLHTLDIGASLGYVCFYLADRGAIAEGWEYNPQNAEVARLVGEINGINISVKTKALDDITVKTIKTGEYDAVTILSVFHHIIHYKGLEYTQKLVKELLDRIPIMIVELAKKGEDSTLFWNKTQPVDELAIFDLVRDDVVIEKIGDFGNHLSKNTRPMYAIKKKDKVVAVNNKQHVYDEKTNVAYNGSPVAFSGLRRAYYSSASSVIKEYLFGKNDTGENLKQIVAEIDTLVHLGKIHNMPELEDFELTPAGAKLVFKKIKGELLVDRIESGKDIDPIIVAKDIIKSLSGLEAEGLKHNDVRSWNVIYDGKKASLIDYGFVSHKDSDNDANSLLWLLAAVITGSREGYSIAKSVPPKSDIFKSSPILFKLYNAVAVSGEVSPTKLLKIFK